MLIDYVSPVQVALVQQVVENQYKPEHSSIRNGFELSSLDFDGRTFAAVGLYSGGRAVGLEVGHKFRYSPGDFKTGFTLTSRYNWLKDLGDTEAKYVMAREAKIGTHGRLVYDMTLAYNLSSGAYASTTVRREFYGHQDYGIFKKIIPYASITASNDRERTNMRLGFTTVVNMNDESRLRLDFATQFTHRNPEFIVRTSFRFK